MSKSRGLFSALLILAASPLLASQYPSAGNLEISGDFLYFMPTVDDTYFVTNSPITSTFPNGTRTNNNFEFSPGFRAGIGYGFCNSRALELSYSWLGTTQNKTINGSFLWATIGRPDFTSVFENYSGSASSSLSTLYQNFEATFIQQTAKLCGLNVNLQAGIEAAYLRLQETLSYHITGSVLGTIDQKSRTWGVGPQFGFDLDYEITHFGCRYPSSLSFFAGASGSILTGETKTNENNVLAGALLLNTIEKNAWRVFPAFHANVGFNYDIAICGWDTSFQIGYEFNTYLRGLSRVEYPDDVADGLSYNSYNNYDVQGLFVSAAVRF